MRRVRSFDELKQRGFTLEPSSLQIGIMGHAVEPMLGALRTAGFVVELGPELPQPAETVKAEVVFQVVHRAIAKIAMNYLAFTAGSEVARMQTRRRRSRPPAALLCAAYQALCSPAQA
jgi:hypothetical protein